jgi:hypothetical protein
MNCAAIMPTLGVGEQVHAGCFSLLVVLIEPEETGWENDRIRGINP